MFRGQYIPHRVKLIIAFGLIYFVWGSTYLGIRFAIETMPPLWMAGIRFLIAGGVLYVLAQIQRPTRTTAVQWWNATVIGALLFGGGNGLVSWAQQTVPSGLASLFIATMPLWMTALDMAFYRGARPNLWVCFGLILGIVGVALLVNPFSNGTRGVDPVGAGFLLLACFSWAFGALQSRHVELPKSPFVTAGMQMLGGGAVLLLCSTLLGDWSRVRFDEISIKSLVSMAYLIVFGSMLALSAFTWLLRNCSASTVATYAYVNPVIAVVLGAWLAGESLSLGSIFAGGLIIGAVVIIVSARRRPQAPTQTKESGAIRSDPSPPPATTGESEPIRLSVRTEKKVRQKVGCD